MYCAKRKKLCFVDLQKAFYRVSKKVLKLAMRKKGIPEALVRSVMSLYERAKAGVRVDSELSEEFVVKVGIHQGYTLPPFLPAVEVDVVIELARVNLVIAAVC